MIALGLSPFLASLLLAATAPAIARRTRPGAAVVMLTLTALALALACGLVLCTAATLALSEWGRAGRIGHWSTVPLDHHAPVGARTGWICGVLAVALAAAAVVRLVRTLRTARQASSDARAVDPRGCGLAVLPDERPIAFAVPSLRGGTTVVSRGLLRSLSADERRAVLAHERAHLRHRHAVFVALADLAVAADPLLRPVAAAVRLAVECWADEVAARSVEDRSAVASALARIGLAADGTRPPAGALCAAATSVSVRVGRLTGPRRRTGGGLAARVPTLVTALVAAVVTAVSAAAVTGALAVGIHAHALFEVAQAVYR